MTPATKDIEPTGAAKRWADSTKVLLPLIDGIARLPDDDGTAEEVAGYMRQAVAHVEALAGALTASLKENEKLRKALRPFADLPLPIGAKNAPAFPEAGGVLAAREALACPEAEPSYQQLGAAISDPGDDGSGWG